MLRRPEDFEAHTDLYGRLLQWDRLLFDQSKKRDSVLVHGIGNTENFCPEGPYFRRYVPVRLSRSLKARQLKSDLEFADGWGICMFFSEEVRVRQYASKH